jgi:hypothetical protein
VTNVELLDLLREARESVIALADEYESLMLATETEEKQRELARRMDEAIAQYEADMVQHHKEFARDVKDLDRHLAAARAWKGDK